MIAFRLARVSFSPRRVLLVSTTPTRIPHKKLASPALAAVIGTDVATYHEAMKLLWKYFTENNLTAAQYRFHADNALRSLFGDKPEIHFREIPTVLKNNLSPHPDFKPTKPRKGPFYATPELRKIVGEGEIDSIAEGVKLVWAYAHKHNLKRGGRDCSIEADSNLRDVYKSEVIHLSQVSNGVFLNLIPVNPPKK